MLGLPFVLPAHGIGGRQDLPISYTLAVYGSGAAVLVSILLLAVAWRRPLFQTRRVVTTLPSWLSRAILSRATRIGVGVLGCVLTFGSIACGAFGTFQAADNFAPTYLYVLLWLGIVPLSLLFGPFYVWFNPARALHAALFRLAGLDPEDGVRPLPERVGIWPAVVGIFAYATIELTLFDPSRPVLVAGFLFAVVLVSFVGGLLFGSDYFTSGDPFEAYSRTLSALSPWEREGNEIRVRNPLRGLATMPRPAGFTAFVCLLVGSTAFDGLSRTPKFYESTMFVQGKSWLVHDGFYMLCLIGVVVIFGVLFRLGVWAMSLISGVQDAGRTRRFAHSILPIALGYAIAHYFSLLVFQSEDVPRLLADPAGVGWHLLPTTRWKVDYTVLTPSVISLTQVGGIVAGHILGVVTAHDTALAVLPERRRTLAQVPLAVVMVLITTTAVVILLNG